MQVQFLYGSQIQTKEQLHRVLAESLPFPDWYGQNLDALWDCLTSLSAPVQLIVAEKEALCRNLPGYGEKFIRLLEDSARENPMIQVKFH